MLKYNKVEAIILKIITYVAKSLITAFEQFFIHTEEACKINLSLSFTKVDAKKTKRWLKLKESNLSSVSACCTMAKYLYKANPRFSKL